MASYRYLHLDVFADARLEGNQLAVVFEAASLPVDVMQAVAREIGFSETVFILPPELPGTLARLRIFTPGREIPMAGHPTIGSAFALAHERRLAVGQAETVVGLTIGPLTVALEWTAGRLAFAWMSQPLPSFGAPWSDPGPMAVALGLDVDDIRASGLPVQSVSCGVPYLLVPVVTREAVDRAWTDSRALRRLAEHVGLDDPNVYVFTLEQAESDVTAYSRMFAPLFGVAEDPATGSAAGPLGCYLVRHRALPPGARQQRIVTRQGVKMLRPSRIVIAIEGDATAMTGVRIGGTSVLVAEGTLHL